VHKFVGVKNKEKPTKTIGVVDGFPPARSLPPEQNVSFQDLPPEQNLVKQNAPEQNASFQDLLPDDPWQHSENALPADKRAKEDARAEEDGPGLPAALREDDPPEIEGLRKEDADLDNLAQNELKWLADVAKKAGMEDLVPEESASSTEESASSTFQEDMTAIAKLQFEPTRAGCCIGARDEEHGKLWAGAMPTLDTCKEKCQEFENCGAIEYGWIDPADFCFIWDKSQTCASVERGYGKCGGGGDNKFVHAYKVKITEDKEDEGATELKEDKSLADAPDAVDKIAQQEMQDRLEKQAAAEDSRLAEERAVKEAQLAKDLAQAKAQAEEDEFAKKLGEKLFKQEMLKELHTQKKPVQQKKTQLKLDGKDVPEASASKGANKKAKGAHKKAGKGIPPESAVDVPLEESAADVPLEESAVVVPLEPAAGNPGGDQAKPALEVPPTFEDNMANIHKKLEEEEVHSLHAAAIEPYTKKEPDTEQVLADHSAQVEQLVAEHMAAVMDAKAAEEPAATDEQNARAPAEQKQVRPFEEANRAQLKIADKNTVEEEHLGQAVTDEVATEKEAVQDGAVETAAARSSAATDDTFAVEKSSAAIDESVATETAVAEKVIDSKEAMTEEELADQQAAVHKTAAEKVIDSKKAITEKDLAADRTAIADESEVEIKLHEKEMAEKVIAAKAVAAQAAAKKAIAEKNAIAKELTAEKAATKKAIAARKAAVRKAEDDAAAAKDVAKEKAAAAKAANEKAKQTAALNKELERKAAEDVAAANEEAAAAKAAAEKTALEKDEIQRTAAEDVAAASADMEDAEKALAAEKAATERARLEKRATQKEAQIKVGAAKALAEQAVAQKRAAEKAAAEEVAAEKAAAEKARAKMRAAVKAADEKVAAEKAAAEEAIAAEKAAAEKKIAEIRSAQNSGDDKVAAEKAAALAAKAAAEKKIAAEEEATREAKKVAAQNLQKEEQLAAELAEEKELEIKDQMDLTKLRQKVKQSKLLTSEAYAELKEVSEELEETKAKEMAAEAKVKVFKHQAVEASKRAVEAIDVITEAERDNAVHIGTKKGKQGVKSSTCATITGDPCVFPFAYKGQSFDKCTFLDGDGMAWCVTDPHHQGWLEGKKPEGAFASCENKCQEAGLIDDSSLIEADADLQISQPKHKQEDLMSNPSSAGSAQLLEKGKVDHTHWQMVGSQCCRGVKKEQEGALWAGPVQDRQGCQAVCRAFKNCSTIEYGCNVDGRNWCFIRDAAMERDSDYCHEEGNSEPNLFRYLAFTMD